MGNTVSQVYVHFTFKGRVTDEMAPATLSRWSSFPTPGVTDTVFGSLELVISLVILTQSQLQLKSRAPLNRCTQHCLTLRTKRIVFDV